MEDKITFDELLNLKWKYSSRNDREDLPLKVFDKDVKNKVASMFLHTKDMYKLLASMDNEEAKELIKKINETNPLKEQEEGED